MLAALRSVGAEPSLTGEHEAVAACPCPAHQHAPHRVVTVLWVDGATHLDTAVTSIDGGDGAEEQPCHPADVLVVLALQPEDLLDEPDPDARQVLGFPDGGRDGQRGDGPDDDPDPVAGGRREPHGRLPRTGNISWAYSTGRDGLERGLYAGSRRDGAMVWDHVAPLPYPLERLVRRDSRGKVSSVTFRLAMTPLAAAEDVVIAAWEQVESGEWAQMLDITLSPDSKIRNAAATAIATLSRARDQVARESAPRWRDGQLEMPPADIAPGGYGVTTAISEQRARELWADVAAIAARTPKLALVLGAALAGIYIHPVRRVGRKEVKPFIVLMHGWTSGGKSSALEAAGSMFGNPDGGDDDEGQGVVMTANWSPRYVGQELARLGVLPMFRDELGESGMTQPQKEQLLLQVANGAQRQFATRSQEPRALGRWTSTLLLTGNEPVLEKVTDAGVGLYARLVEVAQPITSSPEDSDDIRRLSNQAHGWPLRWLREHPDVEGFAAKFDQALDLLVAPLGGPGQRLARHLAMATAGAAHLDVLVGAHAGLGAAALSAAQAQLSESVDEISTVSLDERLLEAVATARTIRKRSFPTRQEHAESVAGLPGAPGVPPDFEGWDLSGDDTAGDLAVLPQALGKIAAAAGIDNLRQALRGLRDRGLLVTTGGPARLTADLRMLKPMERRKPHRVHTFKLDSDLPASSPAAAHAGPPADHSGRPPGPAGGDQDGDTDGPHLGPHKHTGPNGQSGDQSGDHAVHPMTSTDTTEPAPQRGLVPMVPTVPTPGSRTSAPAREDDPEQPKERTGAMGLATLVDHLKTVDGDPLGHVRRQPIQPAPCVSCGRDTEVRIGGVIVHPLCLRELLEDPGEDPDEGSPDPAPAPAVAEPAPSIAAPAPSAPPVPPESTGRTEPPIESAGGPSPERQPAPAAPVATAAPDDDPDTPPPAPVRARAEPTDLPCPGAPGGRWSHALAVVDTDAAYLPDGGRMPLPTAPTDAARVLELGDQLAVGHPHVPGMLIMTEDLCVAAGLDVPAPESVRDQDQEHERVLGALAELGHAFLAAAIQRGWSVDGEQLRPCTRLRRREGAGERVLELALEPYLWVWDPRQTGLVNGDRGPTTLPDITDPAQRWSELARRGGRLAELLGVQFRTSAGLVGADLFDQLQRKRRAADRQGRGTDRAGRNRARVVDFPGERPELAGYRASTPLEPPMSFSPRGGLVRSALDEAEYAHGFDVRKQFLAASKVKLPYCPPSASDPDRGEELTHFDDPEDVLAMLGAHEPSKLPWSLVRLTLPAWEDPRMPEPHPYQRADQPTEVWVTPPTLRLLLEDPDTKNGAGYSLDELRPVEMWQWPEQASLLDPWYDTVSKAIYASSADPAVEAHLKHVYAGYIGRMGSSYTASSRRPWHHQPLWRETIMAQARCEEWRKIRRAAATHYRWPALVTADEVVYLAAGEKAELPETVEPAADNGRIGALSYSRSLHLDDRTKARVRERGWHLTSVWTAQVGTEAQDLEVVGDSAESPAATGAAARTST